MVDTERTGGFDGECAWGGVCKGFGCAALGCALAETETPEWQAAHAKRMEDPAYKAKVELMVQAALSNKDAI